MAAPFIFLLLLGSFYLSRERLSWFPSSQRRPIAYKQLSKGHVVQDGEQRMKPPDPEALLWNNCI